MTYADGNVARGVGPAHKCGRKCPLSKEEKFEIL
jgi:hypothetical protein